VDLGVIFIQLFITSTSQPAGTGCDLFCVMSLSGLVLLGALGLEILINAPLNVIVQL